MMKNLLVLALVLSVAGLATAGISFKVNGEAVADGGTLDVTKWVAGPMTVQIINDASVPGPIDIGWIGVTAATTSNYEQGSVGSANIGTWTIALDAIDGAAMYWRTVLVTPPAGGVSTGQGPLFTVTFNSSGVELFEVYNDSFNQVVGSFTIPEPITMVLLGLGGLFLRRK